MTKTLLERIEKLEQNQAHLLRVFKDGDVEKRMQTALGNQDLATVQALIELGLHEVNAKVGGLTPLHIALDKNGHRRNSYAMPECMPQIAHYLLDAGADPVDVSSAYDTSLSLLCSMLEPESVDRLELLIRCRDRIVQCDHHRAQGVDGIIVTRAVMANRIDLLKPEHLAGDVNEMSVELAKDSNTPVERKAMENMRVGGYSYGLKLWVQPLNYLAIVGTESQFKRGLHLGLTSTESSVYAENNRGGKMDPLSTEKILETLGRDDWVFMLRSASTRRQAYAAIEEMDEASAAASPRM